MKMVGRRIRELRKRLGMPAYVVAKRAAISPNTLWLLECYDIVPRRSACERIAQVLGASYDELFSEQPEREVSQS